MVKKHAVKELLTIIYSLKFKSGEVLKLAVFWLDMLITLFMNIKLCNCQEKKKKNLPN